MEIIALENELEKVNKLRVKHVNRYQLSGLMEKVERGIVTFLKIDDQERVMRFESRDIWDDKDVHTQYLTVFDLDINEFRKVNLTTVRELVTESFIYKIS
jgi:hypothetical protein